MSRERVAKMSDDKKASIFDLFEAMIDDGAAIGNIARREQGSQEAGPEDYDAASDTVKLLSACLKQIGEKGDEHTDSVKLGWLPELRTFRLVHGHGMAMVVIEGSLTEVVVKLAAMMSEG
jgi:hypothetical protein